MLARSAAPRLLLPLFLAFTLEYATGVEERGACKPLSPDTPCKFQCDGAPLHRFDLSVLASDAAPAGYLHAVGSGSEGFSYYFGACGATEIRNVFYFCFLTSNCFGS